MPKQKLIKTLFLTIVSLIIYSNSAQAIQRMGLLSGGNAQIPAGGSGQLPTVCLDEHDEPPSTSDRYASVFNASSPDAVTVEIEGRSIPLQKAIDDGLVSISGVDAPTTLEAEIDAVRINNLSGKPISVRVNQPAVLGAGDHKAFDYDVTKLITTSSDPDAQDKAWNAQRQRAELKYGSTSSPEWVEVDNAAREAIQQHSTKEMRLFHFSKKSEESQLVFADGTSVSLSATELKTLKAGNPLSASHPLSEKFSENGAESHVLYSDPNLGIKDAYVKERDELAFGLQAAYPKANIYRDPLSDETSARAQKLNGFSVTGAKDLLVVIPDGSDPNVKINYQQTITDIGNKLHDAHVEIRPFKVGMVYDGNQGRAVFVITGHSSEQLANFVRQVGEAGFFKNNYVVLNSCGVGPSPALIPEINSKYGAVGTFSFQGEIKPAAVQNYMLDLVQKLNGSEAKKFVPMLIESARSKGLFGIFTISKLMNHGKNLINEG